MLSHRVLHEIVEHSDKLFRQHLRSVRPFFEISAEKYSRRAKNEHNDEGGHGGLSYRYPSENGDNEINFRSGHLTVIPPF